MQSDNKLAMLNQLTVNGAQYDYYDLKTVASPKQLSKLPFSLKILLENLLRHNKNDSNQAAIDHLLMATCEERAGMQIAFTPARVLLQDFTGVPAVVDLAAMRDAAEQLSIDPEKINPLVPVDLVIDHSVMVDAYGSKDSLAENTAKEFTRNIERYQFLRWGQKAFNNFRVVPPGTGIVHQINLEYLASVITASAPQVAAGDTRAKPLLHPDTLVGTDSHTTMINGLGVLGWGVGGIEAEAAMLGQPISMLVPEVVGFELVGALPEGATATDLVLTITERLRQFGVVGKFVEFFGDGLSSLPLADRATIANMAPEYGATCGIFPIDNETLRYLKLTGRDEQHIQCIEAYAKAQDLWRNDGDTAPEYDHYLRLDLMDVEPSIAGPSKPQDRIALSAAAEKVSAFIAKNREARQSTSQAIFSDEGGHAAIGANQAEGATELTLGGEQHWLQDGDIVIAAITSCTNTSNPSVMLSAGLLAKNAVELGLTVKPWVKTSLAPGSQVVPAYLEKAGVMPALSQLGFDVVGFGCTTCIGNSGPLLPEVTEAIHNGKLNVCSVLSGNRNFEGRIHPDVKGNFLASPPLVVAYALAGTMTIDLLNEPICHNANGEAVFLRDIWPSQQDIAELTEKVLATETYRKRYSNVFEGTKQWQTLTATDENIYPWPESTYGSSEKLAKNAIIAAH